MSELFYVMSRLIFLILRFRNDRKIVISFLNPDNLYNKKIEREMFSLACLVQNGKEKNN